MEVINNFQEHWIKYFLNPLKIQTKRTLNEGDYMNIQQKMLIVLISIILLSLTALAASTTHETNSKASPKAPVAAFTASPTSGYAPLKVVFTDKSTGTPTSWNWNFGDGTSSTTRNPVHKYNKAGKYTVTLTVKNAKGSNKITKCNYINVLVPLKAPVAAFTASPVSGLSPLKVVFTDKSTGSPTSWDWYFGDGTYSTAKNPTHTYNKAGKYTVTLAVKNAKGSNKITKYNYISVLAPFKAPVANFSSNVTKGHAPLTVQFNDSSTNATSWSWDFGDSTNSTAKNPIHTYSSDGIYNVTLTAKNADGNNTTTKYNYITVDSTKVVDVVCKMTIYRITAKYTSVYKGTTYYFCSANCKAEFDANPEEYVNS